MERGGDMESPIFLSTCLSVSPSLRPSVPPSPAFRRGGEVNLRFYPNQPGLPRKPIPSLAIAMALENHLCH